MNDQNAKQTFHTWMVNLNTINVRFHLFADGDEKSVCGQAKRKRMTNEANDRLQDHMCCSSCLNLSRGLSRTGEPYRKAG